MLKSTYHIIFNGIARIILQIGLTFVVVLVLAKTTGQR